MNTEIDEFIVGTGFNRALVVGDRWFGPCTWTSDPSVEIRWRGHNRFELVKLASRDNCFEVMERQPIDLHTLVYVECTDLDWKGEPESVLNLAAKVILGMRA